MFNLIAGLSVPLLEALLFKALEGKTVDDLYNCILTGKTLWGFISEEYQEFFKSMGRQYTQHVENIFNLDILGVLREKRPDLWSIIMNTAGGTDWWEAQMAIIKEEVLP